MNANDKAKFLADQCKPCSKDFYDGVYQGAKIAALHNAKPRYFHDYQHINFPINY